MKVGIVGATGAVGREMLVDLRHLCKFPKLEIFLYASSRSAGKTIACEGTTYTVKEYSIESVKGLDVILMSAGSAFSRDHAKEIIECGVWVIDNSSAWRMDENVPLVVPEVNIGILGGIEKPCLVANPNCSTIQMVVALSLLQKRFGLKRVHVSTYQSVSGAGQAGIDELHKNSKTQNTAYPEEMSVKERATSKAFNVIPAIDRFVDGGHCYEEVKMIEETRKIMDAPKLDVLATTVRVPVYFCHSESIYVELDRKVSQNEVIEIFKKSSTTEFIESDDYDRLPTPRGLQGQRGTFISRVRLPYGEKQSSWVQFWNVADNLKKGAATNAVQILLELSAKFE